MEITPFGKYLLLKKLAVGGMAEIFLAKQTGLAGFEKLLVIKRILPEMAVEAEFVQMFLDEARLAASLSHPNVVQIFDLGKVGAAYYIAMEYIAGQDFHTVIARSRKVSRLLPPVLAARVVMNAAEGLHYAHDLKDVRGNPTHLVHRDVTPSNLLVSWDGVAKVVDFGIAKAETQVQKTRAGALKGKLAYMAPEQARSLPVDGRADIWSLGVVLHEALTARKLFKADNELAILTQILEGQVPPPSSIRPDVPPALDAIVAKALERDLTRRYQTGQEMQHDLDAFLRTQPHSTSADLSAFLKQLFAEEFGAYQKLLAEIPTATAEKLAELLAKDDSLERPEGTSFDLAARSGTPIVAPPRSNLPLFAGLGVAAVALVAAAAFALRPPPPPPAPVLPTEGEVEISSDPPGADVTLDGIPQKVKTPTVLRKLPLDRPLEIKLTHDGREARTQVVELTGQRPLSAVALSLPALAAVPGSLVVSTVPPGANVFLDGAREPTLSPLTITGVASGVPHAVLAEKEGFELTTEQVTVDAEESKALTLTLKARPAGAPPVAVVTPPPPTGTPRLAVAKPAIGATGTLDVTSTPPMEVFVGGKSLGHTPLAEAALPAGDALLTLVSKELGLTYAAKAEIVAGKKTVKAVDLKMGKLAVDVQPWADVYIGDKKLGSTPLQKEVYEGTYSVRLVNSDIGALKTVSVTVKAGGVTPLRQDLTQP